MGFSNTYCTTEPDMVKKQSQAIIFAIENYKDINRTKLMKFIFFVDLYNYNKTGNTLLENCYLRLPNGPVPQYGFNETYPGNHKNNVETEYFIMKKVYTDEENSKYYHYEFNLKPNVHAELEKYFDEGEVDLLTLTLQTVMSHRTSYLSSLTHSYDLWKKYQDGDYIALEDFHLSPDEFAELERFLNTKVFLSPLKDSFILRNIQVKSMIQSNMSEGEVTDKLPRLPIYINTHTGKKINL